MKSIGAEFEETAKAARRCRRPEGEFLHQRSLLVGDQGFEGAVEFREVGMAGNTVKRSMITVIALILPDMDLIK